MAAGLPASVNRQPVPASPVSRAAWPPSPWALLRRREIWLPTGPGWALVFLLLLIPPVLWWFGGEPFLSRTRRVPAKILVVESWIGYEGMKAARDEFLNGGYAIVIATGGDTSQRWMEGRYSLADMGTKELVRQGLDSNRVWTAAAEPGSRQRTYGSAVAVAGVLKARGQPVTAVNIFTQGVHARRSRLTFAKVFGNEVKVGVIGWVPDKERGVPWWKSTERAKEFLTESAGYAYELLLNGGR